MKLTTFFISNTKQIQAKSLTVSDSTFKIKAMLPYNSPYTFHGPFNFNYFLRFLKIVL